MDERSDKNFLNFHEALKHCNRIKGEMTKVNDFWVVNSAQDHCEPEAINVSSDEEVNKDISIQKVYKDSNVCSVNPCEFSPQSVDYLAGLGVDITKDTKIEKKDYDSSKCVPEALRGEEQMQHKSQNTDSINIEEMSPQARAYLEGLNNEE